MSLFKCGREIHFLLIIHSCEFFSSSTGGGGGTSRLMHACMHGCMLAPTQPFVPYVRADVGTCWWTAGFACVRFDPSTLKASLWFGRKQTSATIRATVREHIYERTLFAVVFSLSGNCVDSGSATGRRRRRRRRRRRKNALVCFWRISSQWVEVLQRADKSIRSKSVEAIQLSVSESLNSSSVVPSQTCFACVLPGLVPASSLFVVSFVAGQ